MFPPPHNIQYDIWDKIDSIYYFGFNQFGNVIFRILEIQYLT